MQVQRPAHPGPQPSPRRGGLVGRVLGLAGLAAIVLAAVAVPLPVRLVRSATLVDVGAAVSVDVGERFLSARPSATTSGRYLAAHEVLRASPVQTAVALLDPRTAVGVEGAQPRPGGRPQALVDAALSGLGIAPVRGASLADDLAIALRPAPVDPRSLALALQVFDLVSDLDVSRGRTVVALGWVDAEGVLRCSGPVAPAAAAAAEAGADLLLVPSACTPVDGAAREAVTTAVVGTFLDALNAVAG